MYRVFGMELSPYSVKVRSYLRYKALPHEWIVRNASSQSEFEKHARLPLVPLVLGEDGEAWQDSTPILERLESLHPEPSLTPEDPVPAFVSLLLEELGDEWGNKWMFHMRWARELDQWSAAGRLAQSWLQAADDAAAEALTRQLRDRMVGRVGFVGSSEQTAPQIEASFRETLAVLESHLAARPYLLGGRPAYADFGLAPQIYEMWTDPTAGAYIGGCARHVLDWVQRMLWPRVEGSFEPWDSLATGLEPLLEQAGRLFLPWSEANTRALAAGEESFTVQLDGRAWTQRPQRYHAKSLAALKRRYLESRGKDQLDPVLEHGGCLAVLKGESAL